MGSPQGGRGHDGPDGPRSHGPAGHVNPTVQVVNGVPVRECIGRRGCSPHHSHGQARSGMVGLGPATDGARPCTMEGVCAWVSRPGADRRDHRRPRHGLVSAGLPFRRPACASGSMSASVPKSNGHWIEVKAVWSRPAVKSTSCTDGLIRAAGETEIRSPVLWLATDGEEEAAVVSAHDRRCRQGNPGPGGWDDWLTRDDRPGHGLQGSGSEVNTTTPHMRLMAVIEGVQSSPAGREVKTTRPTPSPSPPAGIRR
jgi:hypothetical protein